MKEKKKRRRNREKNKKLPTKFVVLTTWTSFMGIIAARLRREGYVVGELHGALSDRRRTALLDVFARNDDDDDSGGSMQGLVATIGAAGVGAWRGVRGAACRPLVGVALNDRH